MFTGCHSGTLPELNSLREGEGLHQPWWKARQAVQDTFRSLRSGANAEGKREENEKKKKFKKSREGDEGGGGGGECGE